MVLWQNELLLVSHQKQKNICIYVFNNLDEYWNFLKIFWLKYKRNIPSVFCRVLFTAVSCLLQEMKQNKQKRPEMSQICVFWYDKQVDEALPFSGWQILNWFVIE